MNDSGPLFAVQSSQKNCDAVRRYVVIGGGIAGVSCAQELQRLVYSCDDDDSRATGSIDIVLVSLTDCLTEATSIFKVTNHLDEFSVYERSADKFCFDNPHIRVLRDRVVCLDCDRHLVHLAGLSSIDHGSSTPYALPYDKLCICSGVHSKLIQPPHPRVIGIRDTSSVAELVERLQTARIVTVIGNGGIALELIDQLNFCDVHWIVRDRFIGSAFFDASAAAFVMPVLCARSHVVITMGADDVGRVTVPVDDGVTLADDDAKTVQISSAVRASILPGGGDSNPSHQINHHHPISGYGLGPEWMARTAFKSTISDKRMGTGKNRLTIHFEQEVVELMTDHDGHGCDEDTDGSNHSDIHLSPLHLHHRSPLRIRTSSGAVIECDFAVSATGVLPNTTFLYTSPSTIDSNPPDVVDIKGAIDRIDLDEEGYIVVDRTLACVSITDHSVFAAGDCCRYPDIEPLHQGHKTSSSIGHFFQMRLWTQARLMGQYAAQAMLHRDEVYGMDAHFEIFTHITRFFGYKVVLLGRYNAQGLGTDIETVTRQLMIASDGSKTIDQSSSSLHPAKLTPSTVELWVRIIPGQQYIKLVVFKGKVVGALLLGDTDLEEVFENLILDRLDVSGLGIDLLDPDIDIGDYFD